VHGAGLGLDLGAFKTTMADLRLYRALLAVPFSWRGKVLTLAAASSGLLLIALAVAFGPAHPSLIRWALAATALALAILAELLRPIGVLADRLKQCAPRDGATEFPANADEVKEMLADVDRLSAEIHALRESLDPRHPVSGLPSREAFLNMLELTARDPARQGALGVIRFVDYDRLAAFDQAAADRALAAFAERLSGAVHKGRPVGHPAGDCFGVWFDDIESPLGAAAELLALAYVLGQDLDAGDLKITPEVTVGIAVFPDDAADAASLFTRAYAAVPHPGQFGAPKVALFCGETAAAARNRFGLEQGLRQAIGRDELVLHFQPVVDLGASRVVGAEALLRWRSAERGVVQPGEFIPVVEQSGMMEEFGMWVLNAACKEAREWEQRGLTGMKMAVNLSARQIHRGTLLRMVMRTLERHGLQPEALELELTESAALVDDEGTRALLAELRELGISVAIDDFGTGYSSLSNLRKLPFSKLKIDREFVTSVNDHRGNHAICSSLIELARGLGIAVLAEGAETLEEVETLHGLGCSMFQGYFFSRPLPAADFATTIADPRWLALLASPVHREIASLGRRVVQ
jgi:predicted signal transduction protein with EAL and GGDEF domain